MNGAPGEMTRSRPWLLALRAALRAFKSCYPATFVELPRLCREFLSFRLLQL